MSVTVAGRAPASFEIKSATLPLVALLLKSPALDTLEAELAERFGDLPDFFDNDPLVVDLAPLGGAHDVDFAGLLPLLRKHRMQPVAVKGGSEAQMRAAFAAGLVAAPEAAVRVEPRATKPAAPARAEPAPAVVAAPSPSALVVDKPLRSGQQVYARGRDLVVLAMVNPGAEVIADGHIHVYAPLRGKAIAGARGNAEARIFSLSLAPELISIAGVYRTSEVDLPAEILGKPAQVRLEGEGRLVMQALHT
jgi:septum site-determining protein MinC